MSAVRVRAVAALVVSFGMGCALTSLDGFSSGAGAGDASATVDAAPLGDAPGVPGSVEGGGGDAALDGGAAGDGDASGERFCSLAPASALACNDFDRDPYEAGWGSVGAGFGPTPLAFLSAPRSLAATLPARGAGQPNGYLSRRLPGGTRDVTLAYDLRIDDSPSQSAVDVGSFHFASPPFWSVNIRYERAAGGHTLSLFEYGDPFDATPQLVRFEALGSVPRVGAFFRVTIALRVRDDASSVRVEIDGARHDFALSGHRYQSPALTAAVGVTSSDGPGAPFQAYFDNVLVVPGL